MRTRSTRLCLIAAAAGHAAAFGQALPPGPGAFEGTYGSGVVRLELRPTRLGVAGTLSIKGQDCPVSATTDGTQVAGTFQHAGMAFDFSAELAGDTLVLTSGGATYRLDRVGSGNPLAALDAPAGDHATEPAEAFPSVAQHALGIAVRHPEAWRAQHVDGQVAFVPDDTARSADGPLEVYILMAMPWDGEGGDLVAARSRVNEEIVTTFPFLKDSGDQRSIDLPTGRGLLIRYTGVSPIGIAMRLDVYATIRDGTIGGLLAIGEERAIERRATDALRVFRTIHSVPTQRDPVLVGTWSRSESSSDSIAGFSAAFSYTLDLRSDGTFTRSSRGAGGDMGVSFDTGASEDRGTWSAAGDAITLHGDDGSAAEYSYRLVDGSLVLTTGSGNRQIWSRE